MTGSYDAIADFGLLYDSVPAYAARADVPFYVDEATRAGGRVLELGSGTGRILLPIARAGHAIVGVDSSAQMLAYGDFNRAPLAENSPEHIVCAERV